MRDNYYLSMFNYKYVFAFLLSFTFLSSNAIAQYCTTGGPSYTGDSNIESFDITGENSTSISYTGCPGVAGVEDQTALSVELTVGASYSCDVLFGTCGSNYAGAGEVWIDFDGNQTFDASESIGTWSGTPPATLQNFSFTIPATAVVGTHRIRVIQEEGGATPLDPCASFNWGSVTDFSVVISAPAPPPSYCTTGGPSSTADSNLESFNMNGDNATSITYTGCPGVTGVEDQTALIADISTGSSYSCDVQFGTCGSNYGGAGEVWIDFDGNGVFDASESVGTWSGTPPAVLQTYNFTVPSGASPGVRGMRVMQQESGSNPLDPCASFSWGSVTDFSVNIVLGTNCTGIPNPGTTSGDSSTCDNFTVTNTGATSLSGIVYQWQSSTDQITWADVSGANNASLSSTQTASTYYRLMTICTAGNDTVYSNDWYVIQNAATACYCIPSTSSGCTFGDEISRVILNTLDNNSGTGCPSGALGYSDYSQDALLTTTLMPSSTYNCEVYGGAYPVGIAVWIDYNDDGLFDNATERVGYSNGLVPANGSASFPVTLSCTPPAGQHRMRVRAMYNVSGVSVDPCAANFYGETEDYTITIAAPPSCPSPGAMYSVAVTSSSADLEWPLGCSSATAFELEYGPAGFAQGSGTTISGVTPSIVNDTASYTLTGLTANTTYSVYYIAVCGPGDTSAWSANFDFSTSCLPASVPWLDDLENNQTTNDNCWSSSATSTFEWDIVTNGGGTPSTGTGPLAPYSDTNYFFTEASSGVAGDIAELYAPQIDLGASPANGTILSFYYHMHGADMATLYVDVSDGSTWTTLDSLVGEQQAAQGDPWLQRGVSLTGYTGVIDVRFRAVKGASFTGDIAIDNIAVDVNACFNTIVDGGLDQTICDGDTVTLNAIGNGGYVYWAQGGTTGVTSASITVNPSQTTFYTATTMDSVNNCYAFDTVFVNVIPASTSTLNETGQDSVVVNGQVYTQDGVYTQTLTNAAGCDSIITINVDITNACSIDLGPGGTVCDGDSVQINASGQGFYTYTWSTGASTTTSYILVYPTGSSQTYQVTAVDSAGCSATDSVTYTISTGPTIVATGDVTICEGDTVTMSVTGGINQYTWNPSGTPSGTNSIDDTPTITTTYVVTGYDTLGCAGTDTVVVTVTPTTFDSVQVSGVDSVDVNGQTYTQSGVYYQYLTNAAGCDSILTVDVTITTVSGFENLSGYNLSAYPNPTRGTITLKGINNLPGLGSIILTDNKGVEVRRIENNFSVIDLSDFTTGVYYLQINFDDGVGRLKVIKQ